MRISRVKKSKKKKKKKKNAKSVVKKSSGRFIFLYVDKDIFQTKELARPFALHLFNAIWLLLLLMVYFTFCQVET